MSIKVFVLSLIMNSRTRSMVVRKSDSDACSVKRVTKKEVEKPRKLSDVAKEIKKMRSEGKTVPEIASELKVSYVIVNQLVLRSYKMVVRTEEVFKRQEEMRLGLS